MRVRFPLPALFIEFLGIRYALSDGTIVRQSAFLVDVDGLSRLNLGSYCAICSVGYALWHEPFTATRYGAGEVILTVSSRMRSVVEPSGMVAMSGARLSVR